MTVTQTKTFLSWTFVGANGTDSGSGHMTVNLNDQVIAFTGTFDGKPIHFHPNVNFPGTQTIHPAPNTGGADYIYDDYYGYHPGTATNGPGVDVNGILISTGSGKTAVYYDVSLDYAGATQTDFFSITPTGNYVFDNGTFTTTRVSGPPAASVAPSASAAMVQAMASISPNHGALLSGIGLSSQLAAAHTTLVASH